MDETIRLSYGKLYDSFPTLASDVDWVRSTISDVTSAFTLETKIPLREDARYFLLINFAEMIVSPLKARRDLDRLKHDLKHDTRLLVEAASLGKKDKEEISGHDVINALSKNWAELDVMKLNLWG